MHFLKIALKVIFSKFDLIISDFKTFFYICIILHWKSINCSILIPRNNASMHEICFKHAKRWKYAFITNKIEILSQISVYKF